jgi:selenocysteine lyase/cysteine desulfurase
MHPTAVGRFSTGERTYLDTASYGLPPFDTIEVMHEALDLWAAGTADWITDWDGAGDRCRELVAPILGAPADEIALVPAVSVAAAVALASLPEGGEILTPEDEFASILLPALVAAKQRNATVRRVPFDELAGSITPRTAMVITSHVRSNDGRVQDLDALAAATRSAGARVLLDATHSAGILPIDAAVLGLDYVAAAAYKHLLCPRGVAFFRVAPARQEQTPAIAASWRSTNAPYKTYFGQQLTDLAAGAARYDVSLAWHPWLGAEHSLAFLRETTVEQRRDWSVGLADELAKRLGITRTGSSVVAVPLLAGRGDDARRALRTAKIAASGRDERIRLSFHLYNDVQDVERAAEVLGPFVLTQKESQ